MDYIRALFGLFVTMFTDFHKRDYDPIKTVNLVVPNNEVTGFVEIGQGIYLFPVIGQAIFVWFHKYKFKKHYPAYQPCSRHLCSLSTCSLTTSSLTTTAGSN